jgi:adenylate cyclase
LADGTADARCVRACFDAFDRLAAVRPTYVRDFGTPVHCRARLHCRETGDRVLASAALLNLLELPFGISKRPLGDRHLRGKESDVVLYALERARADNAAAAA